MSEIQLYPKVVTEDTHAAGQTAGRFQHRTHMRRIQTCREGEKDDLLPLQVPPTPVPWVGITYHSVIGISVNPRSRIDVVIMRSSCNARCIYTACAVLMVTSDNRSAADAGLLSCIPRTFIQLQARNAIKKVRVGRWYINPKTWTYSSFIGTHAVPMEQHILEATEHMKTTPLSLLATLVCDLILPG